MGIFGKISLANSFGIVLGGLVLCAFGAGLIKLCINKRRLKRDQKIADAEALSKVNDREKFTGVKMHEGDLFGVRAIEAGFYGGVSQSRSNSPAPDRVSPSSTMLTDWSQSAKSANSSPLNSPRATKKKPSPLRLSDDQSYQSSATSPQGTMSPYLSPTASQKSSKSQHGGVMPPSPGAPQKQRPTSYLPRLQFPGAMGKGNLALPTGQPGSRSESASMNSRDTPSGSASKKAFVDIPLVKTPTFSAFPNMQSSPRGRQQQSMFPVNEDKERSSSARRDQSEHSMKDLSTPPKRPSSRRPSGSLQGALSDSPRWNSDKAVLRESMVSKQRVSIYRPMKTQEQSSEAVPTRDRASSISSAMTSTAGDDERVRRRTRSSGNTSIYDDDRSRSPSLSRAHDLDAPRESPFSNSFAISTHSASSSVASFADEEVAPPAAARPYLELNLYDTDRLAVQPDVGVRDRSASEASQGSIGDFYDAYYRQSLAAQRASIAAQNQAGSGRSWEQPSTGLSAPGARRPAPLNLKMGGGALAGDTIVEVPSPTNGPTATFPGLEQDIFQKMH